VDICHLTPPFQKTKTKKGTFFPVQPFCEQFIDNTATNFISKTSGGRRNYIFPSIS